MITTCFTIKNREIIIQNKNKLIGIVGQDKFYIDFADEEWKNLHKTMKLIRSDGAVVKLAILNDEVELTQECYIQGLAKIGFYGTINENDPEDMKILSTDYITISFAEHAYDNEDGIAINEPTPSQWDIIIGQLNEVVDKMTYENIKDKPQTWLNLVGGE